MRHLHYIIQGYEGMDEKGQLTDVTTIDIIAENEDEAIKRAEGLIKKKYYRVSQIVEHDSSLDQKE